MPGIRTELKAAPTVGNMLKAVPGTVSTVSTAMSPTGTVSPRYVMEVVEVVPGTMSPMPWTNT